jgi:putative photosynthetic complex assembly protein
MLRQVRSRLSGALAPCASLALVALVAAFVVFSDRDSGQGEEEAALTAARALRFSDADGGTIVVVDADSGAKVAQFASGTNGFARGFLRGLARERRRFGVPVDAPYLLGHNEEDRLTLRDPALHRDIVFDAFGSTNRDVFASLLISDS